MLAPDWTGSLCFWFSAACVYYATMYYADARQRRRNAPPLDDVGFELSPRLPQLQVVCDSCGVGGALWMFSVLFVGDAAHTEYVRALFDYNALGNLLSATLHVVTVLPTAEFVDSQFPMMGGSSDKLMSNHTYNFGLLLRATTLCYGFPKWVLPLGVKKPRPFATTTRAPRDASLRRSASTPPASSARDATTPSTSSSPGGSSSSSSPSTRRSRPTGSSRPLHSLSLCLTYAGRRSARVWLPSDPCGRRASHVSEHASALCSHYYFNIL